MPAQQRFESPFITIAREALQQDLIGDVIETLRLREPMQVIQQNSVMCSGHAYRLVGVGVAI